MKIVLAGPTLTSSLRQSLSLALPNAPPATAATPIAPLAGKLRSMGHEVHIITTDPTVEDTTTVHEGGVAITYCPLRGAPRYRARDRSMDLFEIEIRHLSAAMAAAKPDIVHAHWTYEFAEAAIRTKLPHLVTMHDLGWDYFWIMRDAYRLMRVAMKYRAMFRVRHLTAVAPFMQAKAKQYGYFGKTRVIPNGIDIPSAPAEASIKYRAKAKFTTIGNAGNIKNVATSLAAFKLVKAQMPEAELHLFGPGLDTAFTGDAPGVFAHGNVDHPKLMSFLENEATVLIHPSRMEACPVIIAEAKARGIPVVAGKHSGGVPYVCGSDAGCLLVDIESPAEIADAALGMLRTHDHYRDMSNKARSDVEHRFDSDLVTGLYVAAYHDVLNETW